MSKKLIIGLIVIIAVIVAGLVVWQFQVNKPTEKPEMYHIGLLQMAPTVNGNIEGFKMGMEELGFKEGENVKYTYRGAKGNLDKLEGYAQELVSSDPDLIFVNTSPATAAVKKATKGTGIPVVFSMVAEPVGAGFVESMESSKNHLTGTSCAYVDIAPKRLKFLKEVDPSINKVLVFYRPEDKSGGPATRNLLNEAPEIGVEVVNVKIDKKEDIKNYLDQLKPGEVDAIMDPGDSMVTAGLAEWGIQKAKKLNIPLLMLNKREVEKEALAGFGVDNVDLGKQSAPIANQVLRGIKPTNIPVETPRKFFIGINLNTAKAIGLEISEEVLNKANLVIE